MMLLDANLLLYAYHSSSPHHQAAKQWLEGAFSSPTPVALCWQTIWVFLRISTNSRVFESPLSIREAVDITSSWLEQPAVTLLEPGSRYWAILSRLLPESQCQGALVMDASLAALALEHGVDLGTTDKDFLRFPQLRVINPLEN